jgi:hypothetical protein
MLTRIVVHYDCTRIFALTDQTMTARALGVSMIFSYPDPASMTVVYNISLQRPNAVGQYRDHNGPRISNQSLDGTCFIWLLVNSRSMNQAVASNQRSSNVGGSMAKYYSFPCPARCVALHTSLLLNASRDSRDVRPLCSQSLHILEQ